jgi:L-methionine (R)-S-oxide reductase
LWVLQARLTNEEPQVRMGDQRDPKAQQRIAEQVASLASSDLPSQQILERTVSILAREKPLWNWVGIYLLDSDELVLGPYVGPRTEHERIPIGVGVCGQAVAESRDIAVDDVRSVDNYLACSATTRSELVVLISNNEHVVGQFDIDSDTVGAFAADDRALLAQLAELVAPYCAMMASALHKSPPSN